MDGLNDVGTGERQQVVVPAEVVGMGGKAIAAEVRLGELMLLDHRAHRAVQNDDTLRQEMAQFGSGVGLAWSQDWHYLYIKIR
jgi:hypothetical protein